MKSVWSCYESLTLETLAIETVYGGQFTLSTLRIKTNYPTKLVMISKTHKRLYTFKMFAQFFIRLINCLLSIYSLSYISA